MMLQHPRSATGQERWRALASLALSGLEATYGSSACVLPHTCRWDGRSASPEGHNPRYALIALLGLAKARAVIGWQSALIDRIWERTLHSLSDWQPTSGDLGLGLWCAALCDRQEVPFTSERAFDTMRRTCRKLDTVDLAWLLLGGEQALASGRDVEAARALADGAKAALLRHWNPSTGLFYRHSGHSPGGAFTRRVPCFANQIYPVMALGVHVQRTGCDEARRALRTVTSRICEMQGPRGQWCWLYDARDGGVIDSYPVFSVHQDGMAPMALLEAGRALGCSFQAPIERGLEWIYGDNELSQSLVLADEGLVLRDIHQRGVERVKRAMYAWMRCYGLRRRQDSWTAPRRFVMNAECRPYHLGWILYAAALALGESGAEEPLQT